MTFDNAEFHAGAPDESLLSEKPNIVSEMTRALDLSQKIGSPKATVLGQEFTISPGVFSPAFYAETAFYTQKVVDLLEPGEDYLDLGCGAGVTTVMAALKGANVTALDINPNAVQNTAQNVTAHGVGDNVRVMESDVYSVLRPDEKFDTIYWNLPFGYREPGTELTTLEKAVFDSGFETHRKFILGAKSHLKPGGQLLMGVSSTLGNLPAIYALAKEAGIEFTQIAEMVDPDASFEIKMQLLQAKIEPETKQEYIPLRGGDLGFSYTIDKGLAGALKHGLLSRMEERARGLKVRVRESRSPGDTIYFTTRVDDIYSLNDNDKPTLDEELSDVVGIAIDRPDYARARHGHFGVENEVTPDEFRALIFIDREAFYPESFEIRDSLDKFKFGKPLPEEHIEARVSVIRQMCIENGRDIPIYGVSGNLYWPEKKTNEEVRMAYYSRQE